MCEVESECSQLDDSCSDISAGEYSLFTDDEMKMMVAGMIWRMKFRLKYAIQMQ